VDGSVASRLFEFAPVLVRYDYSLREIGELFGGLDYAEVAQRIRRTRSSHDAVAARKLIKEMLNV
jgi:hypothetical protein